MEAVAQEQLPLNPDDPANDLVIGDGDLVEPVGLERAGIVALEGLEGSSSLEQAPKVSPEANTLRIQKELHGLLGLWSPLCGMLGGYWTRWQFNPAESELLSEAWAPVIHKHWPGFELGAELAALLVTIPIVLPRLGKQLEPPKPKTDEAAA